MPIGIGAALIGSALIGGVSSYLGGKAASKGNDAAINAEWQMFNQAREDYAPWRQAGAWGLEQLIGKPATAVSPLAGTPKPDRNDPKYWTTAQNPFAAVGDYAVSQPTFNDQAFMSDLDAWSSAQGQVATPATQGLLAAGPGEFKPAEDPGYKFGYQEFIEKPTLQLASATGKLRSSDMLKNLTQYASDYASTKYDSFLSRYYQRLNPLFELAKMGGGAAAGSANASTAAGGNIANLAVNQGSINSGMIAGFGGAAQQALGNYGNYKILDKYFSKGVA